MAREPRAPRPKLDLPGQRPLLQGHLRPGGQRPSDAKPQVTDEAHDKTAPESAEAAAGEVPDIPPEAPAGPTAQPATEVASAPGDAARGKATRTPAETATRRHLEGSEQGPS